jgi:hypothetical protein
MEVDSEVKGTKFRTPHLQWVLVVLANYYPRQVLNLILQHIMSDSNLILSFSSASTSSSASASSSSSGLDEPVSSLTATLNFIVLRFVSHATEITKEGLRKAFPVFFSSLPFVSSSSSTSSSISSPFVNEEGFRELLVMFSVSPCLFQIGIGLILDRLDSQLLLFLDSPSSLDVVSILSKFSSEVSYILLLRLKDLGLEVYRFLVIVEELVERVKEGTPLFSVVNHFHNALLKSVRQFHVSPFSYLF